MTDSRIQFARTLYINNLPEPDRRVYKFVDRLEAALEDQAFTKRDYLMLLKQQSPIKQAADTFQMSEAAIYELVQRIEAELSEHVPDLANKLKLVDFTGLLQVKGISTVDEKKRFYMLSDVDIQ
ncbi:hypothetical protein [Bacillus sp. FJAT-45037]|uniref:hypothetical protein n=1 Tax=Bacillus sp. FJAT-45037 TaxID=2011007 RepID=UPI000C234CB8|nr:hypothetical protein [Bacillus sp. FJAT-45037]